ncbi:MAG: K(+)-transporting ATPase subunit F [Aureliella sp.]
MEWTLVLAFVMAVGLVAYLTMALLTPEKFS